MSDSIDDLVSDPKVETSSISAKGTSPYSHFPSFDSNHLES